MREQRQRKRREGREGHQEREEPARCQRDRRPRGRHLQRWLRRAVRHRRGEEVQRGLPQGSEGQARRHGEDPVDAAAPLQRRHPARPDRQLRRRADGHGRPGRQEATGRPDAADGRPVLRRPLQEGPRHAASGCPGDGPVRRRPGLDHVLRVHGLRRLVLADQPGEARRGVPGDLGRHARAVREGEEEGHRRLDVPRQVPVLPAVLALPPSSARSAAARSSTRSTTWSRTPGRTRPSRPRSRRTTSSSRRATSSRAPPA
ncbi:hypothetical protein OKW18_001556 [Streptomyces pratensis]|nr:hypothetical protein [Streptomyces pratensis]